MWVALSLFATPRTLGHGPQIAGTLGRVVGSPSHGEHRPTCWLYVRGTLRDSPVRRGDRSQQVFGVSVWDPTSYGGVLALLTLVSLVSCLLPALRASRVDPITAVRLE